MIPWNDYATGQHRITCPACGRSPRDKTLGLTIEHDGKGVAHCFRCSYVESFRPDRGAQMARPGKPTASTPPTAKHESLSAHGRELWRDCKPLAGVALEYLQARHCRIPPADGALRWHPSLKHPSGYIGGALVALITDAATCTPLSLHRTWVKADGTKADVEPPRMLLGGHRKQGGVIRLWPDAAVTVGLGIAEGIETALSLAWAYTPVWACIDAGNLKAFLLLPGIETLVIGADNDPAGLAAADECAQRWANAEREVLVTQQASNDLNDILTEAA